MRFILGLMAGFYCASLAAWGAPAKPRPTFLAPIAGGYFLDGKRIDVKQILPPPPAHDSIVDRAEIETILQVQARRTPADIEVAQAVEDDELFDNARVLGPWFTRQNLPLTADFFAKVDADVTGVGSKGVYPRRRPPYVDPRVHPCVRLADSGSYPSGHSLRAWVWALLLSEVFPDETAALAERARAVGWARVIGGTHYPSDTMAGEVLAKALVAEFLKSPALRAELEKCRAEAQPFQLKKAA